jgi:plastocyanin
MPNLIEPPPVNGVAPEELIERADHNDPQASKERAWHDWMMVAVGLTAILSILAVIVSVVALSSSSSTTTTVQASAPAAAGAQAAAAVAPQALTIAVKADDQHGRLGPDHKWHDAFLPADFSVHAGGTVTISINNYDSGPHTFTAPSMNVNAVIPGGGSLTAPQKASFTFKAPTKPGRYQWWCAVPCDPWAMAHDGYMRGVVTVTA